MGARPPLRRGSLSARGWTTLVIAVVCLALVGVFGRGHGYRMWVIHLIKGRPPASVHPTDVVIGVLAQGMPDPDIQFEKTLLPGADGAGFTCVRVGPDHRLYAGTDEGKILRFPLLPDGAVGQPEVFTSLQRAEGGKRLLTGFCFDPTAPADRPVLWVDHGYYAFHAVPDFTGRVTRISGKDLEVVEDVVINLPRSFKDHLTNQPAFGPDGALYIPQGCNTDYGAPDAEWGNRPERLLNGAVLRLDVTKVTPGRPLDVKTPDAGGTYDPFAPRAPLTIYACGIRNAFSLVWASNGRLYVPVNGASFGGNTPAGPGAPALTNVPISEDDWLFRITPGKYYGHPNPRQHHYVLNGGNPGNRHDSSVIPTYPVGTMPDPDWEPCAFDFGPHVSADGIVEYRGRAFGGKLDHHLIVCRFNVGSDLICLALEPDGSIGRVQTGIPGLDHLSGPLDVTEDVASGNLYVCEYAAHRIVLMRPVEGGAALARVEPIHKNSQAPLSESAEAGRRLFAVSCVACHGPEGQGLPHLGADLTQSKFIATNGDDALAAFIVTGRPPGDRNSTMGLLMPPKGANPALDDAGIRQIVAYLRVLNVVGRPLHAVASVEPAADRR